ncbi:hypothetical protein L1049_025435 [Liquidambar formosana]|uniref:Uncharacterized protein n=1 Tax=Liquidambar formosana TaxID=63359 RepID=A0AAP0R4L3_LIQFO
MEENKKYPSLPANYVSLVQLQERWLKEEQLKQRKIEQQQEEERRREEQRLKEKEDKKKNDDNGERCETISKSITRRRPFQGNRRPYGRRTIEVSRTELEEPEARGKAEVEAVVVVAGDEVRDQGGKSDDAKKKKNRKKNKKKSGGKNRKPKTEEEEVTGFTEKSAPEKVGEEEVTRGTQQPVPEKVGKEKLPARKDGMREGMRCEFRWKSKNPAAEGKVSVPEDHPMVEISRKLEDPSMKRGKEKGRDRSRVEMNGDRGRYRGSGTLTSRGGGLRQLRDRGLVWVRKGEVSDGNVAGIRC